MGTWNSGIDPRMRPLTESSTKEIDAKLKMFDQKVPEPSQKFQI